MISEKRNEYKNNIKKRSRKKKKMLSEAQEKNYWVNKLELGWRALKMNEL